MEKLGSGFILFMSQGEETKVAVQSRSDCPRHDITSPVPEKSLALLSCVYRQIK